MSKPYQTTVIGILQLTHAALFNESNLTFLSVLIQPQILPRWNNPKSIRMPHSASPALDAHHRITGVQDTQFDRIGDAPLQAVVDVLLPRHFVEVGFLLGEQEWVDTAVEMAVAGGAGVARDHDDGAYGAVFGEEAGCFAA